MVLLGVSALVCPLGAHAQQGTEPAIQPTNPDDDIPIVELPDAESVFERHIKAIGGMDAFKAHKNRKLVGRVMMRPGNSSSFITIWHVNPDKMFIKIEQPGASTFEIIFDGKNGWRNVPFGESIRYEGKRLAELRDESDFFGEANYKQRYKKIETLASGTYAGHDVYIVHAVDHRDKETQVIFDKDTGLLVGVRMLEKLPNGQNDLVSVVISDYKEFNGILLPMKSVRQSSQMEQVVEFTKILIDVDDVPRFDPPKDLPPPTEKK